MNPYEPKGKRFMDANLGSTLLVEEGDFAGWLCRRHPDGQWVTVREATEDDLRVLAEFEEITAAYGVASHAR